MDVGHSVMCRCRSGFTGHRCEINIDDCASNPCRNAGTCVDGANDYTCTCTLGYTGKDCGVRSDACSLYPCQNGGTCFTHFSGPVCRCPAGFMGTRCEFSIGTGETKGFPVALAISFALGLITLTLVVCAAVYILRQMRRGRKSLGSSVRNDLDTINNRASLSFPREKEAFLIPGGPYKVSNKDAELCASEVASKNSSYKHKPKDYNLAEEERKSKTKMEQ